MSRLVIMEGWINQKNKNKEIAEVYLVLTKTHLKIYKSQINYKNRPDETIRVLDLSESYNILPMSFSNDFTFSIFKKGEKAADRLYLHLNSKADYECWLNEIETALTSKTKEEETFLTNGENLICETKVKPLSATPSNLPDTEKNSVVTLPEKLEIKSSQENCAKLEEPNSKEVERENAINENNKLKEEMADVVKKYDELKENYNKSVLDTENLKQANLQTENKLNSEIRRLKLEKQRLTDKKNGMEKEIENLKNSCSENNGLDSSQLTQIMTKICSKILASNVDLSSYIYCIDALVDKNKPSSFFESLLRKQLINLVHQCPIDLNSNVTILDYLTINIDLSPDSAILFISKLLISLTNLITKTSLSISELNPSTVTLIKNVVAMTKVSKKTDPQPNFDQTILEVAYLLTKKINFTAQFTNGVDNCKPSDISSQFDNFLKYHKLESMQKLVLIELGEHIKEIYQAKSHRRESSKNHEVVKKENPILQSCLNKKWDETIRTIDQQNREISDLYITIEQLSNRIRELEGDDDNVKPTSRFDEILNIYSMHAEVLCPTCQSKAVNLLEMPIVDKINSMVSDFKSYWESLENIRFSLNLKQQYNSGLREIFVKVRQMTVEFEQIMKKFSEVTQRKIEAPSTQNSSPLSKDH